MRVDETPARIAPHPGGLNLTAEAIAKVAPAPGSKVLEIGCGSGATMGYLRDDWALDITGIDLSGRQCVPGRQTDEPFRQVTADGRRLPFPDASFDVVLAECSLSLMLPLSHVLDEVHRVSVPGGYLIVNDLYFRKTPLPVDKALLDKAALFTGVLTEADMMTALTQGGFNIKHWQDHSQVLRSHSIQSLEADGCRACSDPSFDLMDLHLALARTKLGYYQLIARVEDN